MAVLLICLSVQCLFSSSRIGLPQLEMLRTDIINLIKGSRKSKVIMIQMAIAYLHGML